MLAFFAGGAALAFAGVGFAALAAAAFVLEEEDGFTGLFSFAESPFGASFTLPDRPDEIWGLSEKETKRGLHVVCWTHPLGA